VNLRFEKIKNLITPHKTELLPFKQVYFIAVRSLLIMLNRKATSS
jgi:hypothetical protein